MVEARGGLKRLWKNARARILVWAALTGIVMGLTGFGLPLEDALRNMRSAMRLETVKSDLVLVNEDSRTLTELNAYDVTHGTDADTIDKLFEAGARRVFFDRSFGNAGSPSDDAKLVRALKAHSGKVYLGAGLNGESGTGNFAGKVPLKMFSEHAHVVSLMVLHHPFNLSVEFPLASDSPLGNLPSLSAAIGNVNGDISTNYVPDFSISTKSFRSLSYIDVQRGSFNPSDVRDRDVLIVPAAASFGDMHPIPSQNVTVPGGYLHAIGSETLKRGIPRDYGWFPGFALVCMIVVSGLGRGRVLDAYRFTGLVVVLVAAPTLLDSVGAQVDVFPAFAVALISVLRMRSLDRVEVAGETNTGSGLPSIQALRNSEELSARILVALKIRNYGAIIGSFAEHVEAQLASEIVRRIRISDDSVVVYHEGGLFAWLSTIRSTFDLFENLEGLHRIVQNGIKVGGIDVDLSFNCGIDSDFERPLASRVAGAMQSAEEAVRNDELVYQHDGQKHEAQWEISLLTSLDRAIDNGEVWVAYQPKLDLARNRICGAEALVRWTHPERGPISPDKFIRIAEEFHRIERITRFVIRDAVRCAVELQKHGHDLSVSVNISAQLLRNPGLPGMISDILSEHGVSPDRLILEITETDKLDRSSRSFQMFQRLVQTGLRLSIDDFGTGNATIDYLRYLPASEVKIDKTFVSSMETRKDDLLLVQSIIEMAHSLDRVVVAEGVETAKVLEMLTAMKCDMVQGYYISRPVPFRDLLVQIEEHGVRANG
ncbi:diguanylate phosphodiesterase [Novosphingobium sp. Rr 2-17]|uniref:EAL domain-containing protein n=1 Tax=Novosphingobium sp. Rr 2-17 TaxID=555793 RepID=UPI00026994D0|nr:EAL domain-containing protein [Novosphingobium sp. Rr 2-17]EIZ80390.1 diguanylate phosphodiesterase [Novosphingobium sp. Rr 2-17]